MIANVMVRPEPALFAAFVRDVEPRLRHALVASFGPVEGRAATVDALSWAWEHWDRIDQAENKLGYLYRVGQNTARRNGSRAQPGRTEASDEQRLPDVEPALVPALAKLSAQQRTAVLLVHGYGWSQTDVAHLLDVKVSTLREHLARGLIRLRTTLGVNDAGSSLGEVEGVETVIGPNTPPQPALIARDGQSAFVVGEVSADTDSADVVPALEEEFEGQGDVALGGVVVADEQIAAQSEKDLQRAELIAFPLLFVLSLLFFRSVVAATLPLVLGGIAAVGAIAVMRVIHEVVPIAVTATNVVTALGLGLAIDYSLFIVSRFREELARGLAVPQALERTLSTAGRAVSFSGITVAGAMASLLVFPQQSLYSVGISGIAVALLCAVAALLVLPALLAILGERVNALSPAWLQRSAKASAVPDAQGNWYRFSHWVMRHPASVAIASAAVLIALAAPALGIKFIPENAGLLPEEQSAGAVDRKLAAEFKPDPQYPVITQWVSPDPGGPPPPWVLKYREDALNLGGVVAVPPPVVVGQNIVRMDIFTGVERATAKDRKLVDRIEELDSPPEAGVRVGGLTASQIDEEKSVLSSLPLAAAILITTTVCALFAMTGSLLLPLKALVMNALTIGATLGLMVLVFQDGNLESLFGFESGGGLLIGVVVIVVVAGFGLSTDYGVFSLARIRELRDSGASNTEAVALGLERTGRLVTSAALLFAVAMGALVTGSLIGVKESGFGLAVAVLIDSTIVRALLVPSLMALLGDRNWWAPKSLQRFTMAPEE